MQHNTPYSQKDQLQKRLHRLGIFTVQKPHFTGCLTAVHQYTFGLQYAPDVCL